MPSVKIGVQLQPQHTSVDALRRAWREADDLEVDSIWLWDHFYPLYTPPDDDLHFECWTLLAAMAVDTQHARFGALVTSNSYRNPDLLADMARTIDHLSGGRFVLGIGAGWFERDYDEYGYEFGTAPSRLRALGESLPRIRARLDVLTPPPVGDLPILIGGRGEKVTLRLVAEHAQLWNTFPPAEEYDRLSRILDEHCAAVGRNPAEIERTVLVSNDVDEAEIDALVEVGARHVIVGMQDPFDLSLVRRLLARR
jgi:probable F420-dependent oxidoreductase